MPQDKAGIPLLRAEDILETIKDAFVALDREWHILYANREACRINQKPLEDFVGKVHWDEWPAAIGTEIEYHLRRAMDERVAVHFETHYLSPPYDVWLENDVYPSEDGLNLFYRDITDRKRTEEALRKSERRFREMADAIPHIAWTTRPDGAVDYFNQRWYDYSGLTLEQTGDGGWENVIHPDDLERAISVWRAAIQAGLVSEVEYRLRRADGQYRWHLGRSLPVAEHGEVVRWVGTATDIEERRIAEQALRRSKEDLRLAVDGAQIGTFYCDYPLDKIIWNDTCKAHFFLAPDAEVDFDLFYSLLHPDDRDPTRHAIERALAERVGYDVEYRTLAPDGRTHWVNAIGRFHYDTAGQPIRFDGITLDISERKATDEALQRRAEREHFLAELTERSRWLTDPEEIIADAVRSVGEFLGVSRCIFADIDVEADTCTIHPSEYRADASVASIVGVVSIASFGAFVVSEYSARRAVVVDDVRLDPLRAPTGSLSAYEAIGIRAHITVPVVHSGRVVSCMSVHNATPRHWQPEEIELLRTVVERTWLTVEVTRQERALVREAQATTRLLGNITDGFIALDKQWRFTYINDQAERVVFKKRDEVLGRSFWDIFPEAVGSTFEQQYRRAVTEDNVVTFEEFFAPLEAWFEVRAYPSEDGLSVFFQNINARKQAETEREQLLVEQRLRAEREALLNRIGQSLRASLDPETVQATATTLLGEALGADRCYFATYNLVQGVVTIGRDWHRPDLLSVQGVYPFVNTAAMFAELYQGSNASVIEDARTAALSTQTKANMEALGLRSRVSVALVESDGIIATLTAAMADSPRSWTEAEASLVEAVATQLRTAVETARVTQREHRIAQQLQAALQPPTPASVPGLTLADYYRPAWEDQGVGGDFSDIFSDDKGTTFLVVGDLSGKGLAAASQVAMVRNMLRFSLYNGRSVAGPVTALNRTLADHDLLTGFTTLFVGRYDAGTRVLDYVNCGQDAGLVLRAASGDVETLPPTGPVLGAISSASYTQETTTLEAGDVLALYTDGLTEAGPSRTALLTGDGVADLLKQQTGIANPRIIVERLIAGVDAYAGAGVRDDQCLLVAVVDHFANS